MRSTPLFVVRVARLVWGSQEPSYVGEVGEREDLAALFEQDKEQRRLPPHVMRVYLLKVSEIMGRTSTEVCEMVVYGDTPTIDRAVHEVFDLIIPELTKLAAQAEPA